MHKPLKCSSSLLLADVAGGLVFGIPLSQCIENDRIARIAAGEVTDVGCLNRSSRHGSRTSFSSLIETPTSVAAKTEEVRNYREYINCYINKIYLTRLISYIYMRSLYSLKLFLQILYAFYACVFVFLKLNLFYFLIKKKKKLHS